MQPLTREFRLDNASISVDGYGVAIDLDAIMSYGSTVLNLSVPFNRIDKHTVNELVTAYTQGKRVRVTFEITE